MRARQFLAATQQLPPTDTPVKVWLDSGWAFTGVVMTWDTGNELLVLNQRGGDQPMMIDLNSVIAYQVQPALDG